MGGSIVFALFLVVFALITVLKMVRVVPQQYAFVVERLGKYHTTLHAGMHFVIPFVDKIAYKHSLKEIALDIEEQICITRDNVQVGVDGILYFQVMDPMKASYGVANFVPAIVQLAQTTLRSEIGKLELDRTLEERSHINTSVVNAVDQATDDWGVKVKRYEIKTINPPKDVQAAMEKQMRAEREKRAVILTSEGERDAKINYAEGSKQQTIKNSEAEKQKKINEALGQAEAIQSIAQATADGLRKVADALSQPNGKDALKLRVAEEYIKQFGNLAKTNNTMIIPANTGDLSGMIATAMGVLDEVRQPKIAANSN